MESIGNIDVINKNKDWIAVDLVGSNQEYSVENNGVKKELTKEKKSRWLFGFKREGSRGKQEPLEENNQISESLWEKFARTTTGHGFARIVDKNEPLKSRIFWVVAVILLTIGLFTSLFIISYDTLVLKGLRREFIVQHNSSLNLPDIHICDTSLFNDTILKEMGFNNSLASYIALALSPHLASHRLQENNRMQQDLEIEYHRLMKNRTIQEVFEKASLKCEDIILGCTHNTIAYSSKPCCKIFFGNQRYVTDLATLCISTHNQPPLEELFVSQIYGFTVYLKTGSKSRFGFDSTIISSNVASRRGIIYAVSNRITTVNPAISTSGYYTTPGTWTSVSITLTRTDNTELAHGLLSPYSCAPANSTLHHSLGPSYRIYSERNCAFASARSVLEAKINCSRFRLRKEGNFPTCEPKVMIDAYSFELASAIKKKTSNCPQDCIFDDYQVTSSSTTLHLGDHDDMHMMDEEHDGSIVHTAIHFFYPSFSFTIIKNHPQSVVKWLSEVGGNMSLFVGASFVTLLEFVVLVVYFVRLYFPGGRRYI